MVLQLDQVSGRVFREGDEYDALLELAVLEHGLDLWAAQASLRAALAVMADMSNDVHSVVERERQRAARPH